MSRTENSEFPKTFMINVKTGEKKADIFYDSEKDAYFVSLKSKPEKNRANEELIRLIERISCKKAIVVAGKKSNKKIIRLD